MSTFEKIPNVTASLLSTMILSLSSGPLKNIASEILDSVQIDQWWSGTALKAGRPEVPGSNPGRACRPSRSEFSVVFFETSINTG